MFARTQRRRFMNLFHFGKSVDDLAEKAIKYDSEVAYHKNMSKWFIDQANQIDKEVHPMDWAANKQKSMDHADDARLIEIQAKKAWAKVQARKASKTEKNTNPASTEALSA